MHIYTSSPLKVQSFTKFSWAASEELRWQTLLSSTFNFDQISKFKKGVIPREKNWIKIFCECAHLHIMSFITTKFQEILFSGSEELRRQIVFQ